MNQTPAKDVPPPRASLSRLFAFAVSTILLGIVIWMADPSIAVTRLLSFPKAIITAFLGLLFLNLFVVSFRFWRVLTHLGIRLTWGTALRASMAGNLAGLFFIPLVGQVAGRQTQLLKTGVSPVLNAGVAAYERVLLLVISGSLAIWGTLYLFGRGSVINVLNHIDLGQAAAAAICGMLLSYLLGRGRLERDLVRALLSLKALRRITEIGCITLLGQMLMLSCFVLGFGTIAPQLKPLQLLSAAAMVSFAASLPLSTGGWGVRELASVYVMGRLGVPAPDAMAVSVLIGLCSTLVLLGAIPFVTAKTARQTVSISLTQNSRALSLERVSAWLLGSTIAVAVLFQVHTPLAGGVINLNLADPFALFALISLVLQTAHQRSLPQWRVKHFNTAIAFASLALVAGFFVGKAEIGVTQWALGGRIFGWLVLMGYCAAGALLVAQLGGHGLRRFTETIVSVLCSIILLKILLQILSHWGLVPDYDQTLNFEGFSGNRNSFAFQLLVASLLIIAHLDVYRKIQRHLPIHRIIVVLQGIIILGIVLSGSRTAIIIESMLIIFSILFLKRTLKSLLLSVCISVSLWIILMCVPMIPVGSTPGVTAKQSIQSYMWIIHEGSDHMRWVANQLAFAMWQESPLLGIGLGVFLAKSPQLFGNEMIIHNTPLWLLTELGLYGLAAFGWLYYLLAKYALPRWRGMPRDRALFLLLLVFSLFCQIHEILYQRIFWLALGALLARPFLLLTQTKQMSASPAG